MSFEILFRSGPFGPAIPLSAQDSRFNAIIRAEPLARGRIEPTLFGNFMELLDDVVPGSWAELTGVFASASLSQSGLSTRKNMQYNFSTSMRGDEAIKVTVQIKVLLPTDEWFPLASAFRHSRRVRIG